MKLLLPPLLVYLLSLAALVAAVDLSYASLPARLATHFDLAGRPNSWMSRAGEAGFTVGFGVGLSLFVVGLMALTGRIPVSFVNLPHRDYWLAPERLPATRFLLLRFGLYLASLIVLFMAALHELVVTANLPGMDPHLSTAGISWVAGAFLAGVVIWSALLLWRFNSLPHDDEDLTDAAGGL